MSLIIQKAIKVCCARQYLYIFVISIVSLILSTRGISDEGIISLNGDMPRYMMNGVYFHDLIRDLPFSNFIQYTLHYFAKYPALTLGHHPLLPGVALAPFYSILGISVFSARLMVVAFLLLAGITFFILIKNMYDEDIALISSLLLMTNPFLVKLSRVVMSEIPTLALMIITTYFFYRFCKSEKKIYACLFVISSVMSVYAKHTAIVMLPFFLGCFIITKGISRLFKKDVIISSMVIISLILPLVPITLKFSQYNVALSKKIMVVVSKNSSEDFLGVLQYLSRIFFDILQYIWQDHFTIPFLTVSLISIIISLYRRRRNELTFVLWIVFFFFFSVYYKAPAARHTIYWIPAFCLLAATPINLMKHRIWKASASAIIILIVGYQFMIAFRSPPEYARGYEKAAEYIVNTWKGDSVLYSSRKDTGYFIFFIRKHNKNQNMIVLRANKILATSAMNRIVGDRIQSRREIYDTLDKFGIAYIVLEDKRFRSKALNWLREEVKSERFFLHKRIPIQSSEPRCRDATLDIYEYIGYTKARSDAELQMNIPLMGDSISVRFNDLLEKKNP
ncbi:MAG: glycosyltransferase family 39 protein [Thermodesulfobacteriota bacterium]|nr:glycosyltransferase family 39 protein [Thermodesulfobacteriota bacterium]